MLICQTSSGASQLWLSNRDAKLTAHTPVSASPSSETRQTYIRAYTEQDP